LDWLNKLERKCAKIGIKGIRGLMKYIIGANLIVFILGIADPTGLFMYKLMLIPSEILQGEVWRLITFLFIPPTSSPLWLIFALYFYYLIGTSLENEWGTFKFSFYYFTGAIFTIIAAFISAGIATPIYLNMSLFLAFAWLYPNFTVYVFFFLPVKMKYLAILNVILVVVSVVNRPFSFKIAAIFSFLNFLLFFGKDLFLLLANRSKSAGRRKKFELELNKPATIHNCTICGRTELDDQSLEFRYCADCEGDYEYCMDHLHNHQHIRKTY
jgi:membrane associated rhomboid family serine protease